MILHYLNKYSNIIVEAFDAHPSVNILRVIKLATLKETRDGKIH